MFALLLKVFGFFLFVAVAALGGVYVYWSQQTGEAAAERAFFMESNSRHEQQQQQQRRPLVIAHRGGAGLFPENTLYAFQESWKSGVDVLEMDVRETADGALVLMHDRSVQRTTDGEGEISAMSLDAVKRLNAGFRFTPDGGLSFPFREKKIAVPTLEEVFAALPEARYVIEPKQESATLVKSLCRLVRERRLSDKVIVGSFSQTNLDNFRRDCSEVATSAGPAEISKFLALYKTGLSANYSPPMAALQTPEYVAGIQVVSKEFVESARRLNLPVHVWTVNEPSDMQRLLAIGVDGIMTDYPDRLLKLLGRKAESGK